MRRATIEEAIEFFFRKIAELDTLEPAVADVIVADLIDSRGPKALCRATCGSALDYYRCAGIRSDGGALLHLALVRGECQLDQAEYLLLARKPGRTALS
jgi:hypothetical protein